MLSRGTANDGAHGRQYRRASSAARRARLLLCIRAGRCGTRSRVRRPRQEGWRGPANARGIVRCRRRRQFSRVATVVGFRLRMGEPTRRSVRVRPGRVRRDRPRRRRACYGGAPRLSVTHRGRLPAQERHQRWSADGGAVAFPRGRCTRRRRRRRVVSPVHESRKRARPRVCGHARRYRPPSKDRFG